MSSPAELRDTLRRLRAVQAGWAFGVPEDGRDQWLDLVIAAVGGPQFGTLDAHGRLPDASGHDMWQIAALLPRGREAEVTRWLTGHGIEVYRMWKPGDR